MGPQKTPTGVIFDAESESAIKIHLALLFLHQKSKIPLFLRFFLFSTPFYPPKKQYLGTQKTPMGVTLGVESKSAIKIHLAPRFLHQISKIPKKTQKKQKKHKNILYKTKCEVDFDSRFGFTIKKYT